MARVLVVGLGNMGQGLAARLKTVNHFDRVSVWNRTAAVSKRHAEAFGTHFYSDLSMGVQESDFVVSILQNSAAVGSLLKSLGTRDFSHVLWIDATSGNPAETRNNAAMAKSDLSMRFVDCAVSGGPHGALDGTLMGFVGGEAADVTHAEPVIGNFTRKYFHFGPVGSGHAVKAVNNTLLAANLFLASEALETLATQGVDVNVAAAAIAGGSGGSLVMSDRMPRFILNNKFDYGFSMSGLAKDVRNAVPEAETEADATAPFAMLPQVRKLVDAAETQLGGNADHTEIAKLFKGLNLL